MNSNPCYVSALYTNHATQVALVNNLYNGVDDCVQYLTKFPRESQDVYLDRQSKATLKNFVRRIATSTRNVLLNKPATFDVDSKIEPLLANIDKTSSIDSFLRDVALQQIKDGFCYIVIDAPEIDESIQTLADQKAMNIEPYMYVLPRSSVVNWEEDADGNFVRVTIKEAYEKNKNKYDIEYGEQHRCYLAGGLVEIWRDGSLFKTKELGVDFIPIVKVDKNDVPSLYDLAKLNISYFNRRSNLDRYLSISAVPVPILYGSMSNDSSVVIGVDDALVFSDKSESGFEWAELSGNSIAALQEDLKTLEDAILQEAVTLTSDNFNVAKNETQVNSENLEGFGKLTTLAVELEAAMTKALKYLGEFKGATKEPVVMIDKEYKDDSLTHDDITDIVTTHAAGLMSTDSAITKLIEGRFLPEDTKIDEEKSKLMV